MTEYEMKIREAANDIKYMRSTSGAMYSQMIFSLISILLAKKKISHEDLEVILEAERGAIRDSVKSYAESAYGQENSAINRTEDLNEIEKLCLQYVEKIKKVIIEVSKQIAPAKKVRKKRPRHIVPKADVDVIIPPPPPPPQFPKGRNRNKT